MIPLVLIPGLGNTAAIFDSVKAALGPGPYIDVNLVAPEVTDFAAMLDHVRMQLPTDPFDLLGFSMGGYGALALAAQAQVPIRRLLLLNSRAVDDDLAEAANRARTLKLLENPKTRYEGMTLALFRTLVGPESQDDGAMLDLTRRMALAVGRDALAAQIRANQTRPDQSADLAKVSLPTLIIAGQEDRLTPPHHAERLHAGLINSKLHILPGCGHLSPLERPQEVAALIAEHRR